MKRYSILLFLAILISLCICTQAENAVGVIPKCTAVPIVDGAGDDTCWRGNKLSFFITAETCAQNGGYTLSKNYDNLNTDCTVDMVWSDLRGKEGLYIKVTTLDITQSYALPAGTNAIDTMDHFRIVIDPLYKRWKTTDNCALDFVFAPYTAAEGAGENPEEKAAWWEFFSLQGCPESEPVRAASSVITQKDVITEKNVISGYTMEIFIPVSTLKIGNYEPTFKTGAKMGIGLAVADYEYSVQEDKNILLNLFADFGGGEDRFNIPQKYNTYILADENGSTASSEDKPTTSDTPTENTGEEMFTLRKSLVTANNVLNNENTASYYTDSSLSALKAAVIAAEKITASNTIAEIKQARQSVDSAYAALETKESLRDLLSRAGLLQKEDYTSDSWEVFSQAKQAASNFDEAENSERGRNVKIALIEAIANLTPVTSDSPEQAKENLSDMVTQSHTLKKSEYTEDSWNRFSKALTAAEDLLLSSSAISAARYDSAAKALVEARNALVKANRSIWPLVIIIICAVIVIAGIIALIVYIRKSRPSVEDDSEDDEEPAEQIPYLESENEKKSST